MGETLQYRKVIAIDYSLGNGETKINMEGTLDNYYSKLDKVDIDPNVVNLSNLKFTKNSIKIHFSSPIICNINSGKHLSSMLCGAKLEGKNENLLVERLEDLAAKLGYSNDESVMWRKNKKNMETEGEQ
jgi:hypothetical protein